MTPLFEIATDGLVRRKTASFAELGLYERADLQRLLRDQPDALGEDLLVISEEFGHWEDSRRRIDLLAIDGDAHLVVIELKRTDDGGHMELQALRYAAMVSAMSFDEVVATYERYLTLRGRDGSGARAELNDFLGFGEVDPEAAVSTDVRIILVAADFGREITTAVLWLNRLEGMDIRCIRLAPYEISGSVYVDIQQVIPLPAAADYQVRLRRKEQAREASTRTDNRDFTRYRVIVDGKALPEENKRNTVRVLITELHRAGVDLQDLSASLPTRGLRPVPGRLSDRGQLEAALKRIYPTADPARWFCEFPIYDASSEQTYVISRMWGRETESVLEQLVSMHPEAGVGFRRAEPSGDNI